jgi:hypothetical protein
MVRRLYSRHLRYPGGISGTAGPNQVVAPGTSARGFGAAPSDWSMRGITGIVQTKTGYDSGPLSLAQDVPSAVMPFAALLKVAHREGASCTHRHAATVSETKK